MESKHDKPTLHYLIRQPKLKTDKPPLLILLHGIGSNEQDLFSFSEVLPDKYLVVSARAPITLGLGAYAWFNIDFRPDGSIINEEEAESARKQLLQFIDDLKEELVFDDNQVFLAGFSQGGIMSYSVALTAPEKIAGIAVMSGRLLAETQEITVEAARLKHLRLFISHGTQDPVLPFAYAEEALHFLKGKGLNPEFHSYHDGHTVTRENLFDLIEWLS